MEFVAKRDVFEYTSRKTPCEAFWLNGDFTDNFATGETIVSSTVTCEDKDGEDTSSTMLSNTTQPEIARLRTLVQAGEVARSPYTVRFRVVTSEGQKMEIPETVTIF